MNTHLKRIGFVPLFLPVVDPVRKVIVIANEGVSRCCPVVQLQRKKRYSSS